MSESVPGREHHSDWFRDIDHPDARLIAAAPEMLEALEAAFQLIPSLSVVQWPPGHALKRETQEKVRKAILKAKGGA